MNTALKVVPMREKNEDELYFEQAFRKFHDGCSEIEQICKTAGKPTLLFDVLNSINLMYVFGRRADV